VTKGDSRVERQPSRLSHVARRCGGRLSIDPGASERQPLAFGAGLRPAPL
jgi:hypothetical protein